MYDSVVVNQGMTVFTCLCAIGENFYNDVATAADGERVRERNHRKIVRSTRSSSRRDFRVAIQSIFRASFELTLNIIIKPVL